MPLLTHPLCPSLVNLQLSSVNVAAAQSQSQRDELEEKQKHLMVRSRALCVHAFGEGMKHLLRVW